MKKLILIITLTVAMAVCANEEDTKAKYPEFPGRDEIVEAHENLTPEKLEKSKEFVTKYMAVFCEIEMNIFQTAWFSSQYAIRQHGD